MVNLFKYQCISTLTENRTPVLALRTPRPTIRRQEHIVAGTGIAPMTPAYETGEILLFHPALFN